MTIRRQTSPHSITNTNFLRLWSATVLITAATLAVWLSDGTPAESNRRPADAPELTEPTAPVPLVAPSPDDPNTAFPEDQAGFSAYYRVDGQDSTKPRLNVLNVTKALLDKPRPSNAARAGAGSPQHLGSNFGIVELPMFATVGGYPVDPRKVIVYYDDRGWVVAYLPKGEPAAAIWRYDTADPDLNQNLLVLAINEVLNAAELTSVTHDGVDYYDWQNADCNAFLLFSNEASGGTSNPVNFVIPPTIADVQASAAVLITSRYSTGGDPVSASVVLDGQTAVTADATTLLEVAKFDIARQTDESNNRQTSLHKMTVTVSGGDTATGVVMLLYDKP